MSVRAVQQPVLRTPRLILRAPEPRDTANMQLLAGDKRVADMTLTIPHPYPDGAAETWLAERNVMWNDGTGVTFAITLPRKGDDGAESSGELIGAIGLSVKAEHARAEIGYWVGVPHWNLGYVTEASVAVMDWGFRVLELNRIEARYYIANIASGRVMQKLGMQFEGIHREYTRRNGVFRDIAVYATLARDAPPIRANP